MAFLPETSNHSRFSSGGDYLSFVHKRLGSDSAASVMLITFSNEKFGMLIMKASTWYYRLGEFKDNVLEFEEVKYNWALLEDYFNNDQLQDKEVMDELIWLLDLF